MTKEKKEDQSKPISTIILEIQKRFKFFLDRIKEIYERFELKKSSTTILIPFVRGDASLKFVFYIDNYHPNNSYLLKQILINKLYLPFSVFLPPSLNNTLQKQSNRRNQQTQPQK